MATRLAGSRELGGLAARATASRRKRGRTRRPPEVGRPRLRPLRRPQRRPERTPGRTNAGRPFRVRDARRDARGVSKRLSDARPYALFPTGRPAFSLAPALATATTNARFFALQLDSRRPFCASKVRSAPCAIAGCSDSPHKTPPNTPFGRVRPARRPARRPESAGTPAGTPAETPFFRETLNAISSLYRPRTAPYVSDSCLRAAALFGATLAAAIERLR